ncbi:MAG: diguanylate cyclase/phosphodiesterase with and sensor(s) [Ilumatobacteraceae bacterium]|nr:diguanylate cyclase/phosphodiesterase with and sensor(s) [Ilumatobacteraceae bacterium]
MVVDEIVSSTFEWFPDAVTLSLAVRDADGRAIDMRLLSMNRQARSGQPDPEGSIGRLCSELWPQMVVNGSFAACMRVLDTGVTEAAQFWWTEEETYAPAGYDYKAARVGADHLLWVLRDSTDTVRRLEHDEARFRAAFDAAPAGMAMVTASGEILLANGALADMVGGERSSFGGTTLQSWIVPDDRQHVLDSLATVTADVPLVHGGEVRLMTFEMRFGVESARSRIARDPVGIWAGLSIAPLSIDHETTDCYVVHLLDVTVQKKLETELTHQALHDPLTGLANRALLNDRMESAIARLDRHRCGVAVIFIDTDHFKVINDGLGHRAGDEVLMAVASRLRRIARVGDTVARFGGDEFVVVCDDLDDEAEAHALALRINEEFRRPLLISDRAIKLSVSTGVATTTDSSCDPQSLLRDADVAMYRAKAEGRDRSVIFNDDLRASALRRMELEHELRHAINHDELVVHYQPIVQLATGRITGVEALVRWQHPVRGLVLPNEFIPLAEDTGLVVALGEWVLAHACLDGRRWHDLYPDLTISVNLSAHQIEHPDLMACVRTSLAMSGIDPTAVTLELTETVLMRDPDFAAVTLHGLKNLGVHLSLDDFGTGYSSLAYLHQFPIDSLKIDRTFVAGLGDNPGDAILCTAIVGLANALGMDTVAEGVETELQLEHVRQLGCTSAQGFYLSRPQSAESISRLLTEQRVGVVQPLG